MYITYCILGKSITWLELKGTSYKCQGPKGKSAISWADIATDKWIFLWKRQAGKYYYKLMNLVNQVWFLSMIKKLLSNEPVKSNMISKHNQDIVNKWTCLIKYDVLSVSKNLLTPTDLIFTLNCIVLEYCEIVLPMLLEYNS